MRATIVALMLMSVPATAQVVIDKILVDPVGNESRNDTPEIIIILNQGSELQDMSGWTLSSTPPEAPDVWFFPWGAILEPGDSMMVFWRTPQGEETPAIHPPPAYTGTSDITLLNNDAADLADLDDVLDRLSIMSFCP